MKVRITKISELAQYDPLMKLAEACDYAAVSDDTLRRAMNIGELAVVRNAGRSSHIRIRLSEMNRWLKSRETGAL